MYLKQIYYKNITFKYYRRRKSRKYIGGCMHVSNKLWKPFLTTAIKSCFAIGTWNLGHFSNIHTYSCEEHVSSHPCENPCDFNQHINPSCSADTFQSLAKKTTKPQGTSFRVTEPTPAQSWKESLEVSCTSLCWSVESEIKHRSSLYIFLACNQEAMQDFRKISLN